MAGLDQHFGSIHIWTTQRKPATLRARALTGVAACVVLGCCAYMAAIADDAADKVEPCKLHQKDAYMLNTTEDGLP